MEVKHEKKNNYYIIILFIYNSNFKLNLSSKKINKEYKNHNISIKKEIDRLSISGRFKREDKVNIILYKNMKAKYYNFKVSKKPYTALCVDIFTEDENENGIVVTKYINQDNLKGKYSIYVEINGKIYNTGEYVKF